jgi:F-type H+-transporting ATPase subunit a
MQTSRFFRLLLVVLLLGVGQVTFADSHEPATTEEKEFNAGETIMHHIGDSHEWHFTTVGHTHVSIPLPVILFTPGKGLDVFMSSNFQNAAGEADLLDASYGDYTIHHDKIHNKDEAVHTYDISITKNVASLMISAILLISVFLIIAGRYKKNKLAAPSGIQSFFEPIIAYIIDDVAKPILGDKYKKYLPYLLTVFFFIWFNNLLGLLPGGANLTGNIAITMTLAVITFLITNISGNGYYWKHILWTPGVPLPLRIIILPIEVVGIFTKPFSLMIRLFANITAGHIIILAFIGLIFIFKSVGMAPVTLAFGLFMMFLELFVAILQAYIFTLLSAMYIGSAVEVHDHPDHDHGH